MRWSTTNFLMARRGPEARSMISWIQSTTFVGVRKSIEYIEIHSSNYGSSSSGFLELLKYCLLFFSCGRF